MLKTEYKTIKVDELTPVEKRGKFFFKRDDLFVPYPFSPINGSKLRQGMLLVAKNEQKARRGIITGTSILSPQAGISATIAKGYGYPCTIYYGGTTYEALSKMDYPLLCKKLGANVEIISKSGMTSVLNSKVEQRVAKTGELAIRYGFDLRNNLDVFVQSVANQVQNIPDGIDNLYMVVGSSITLIGVLCGIAMYNKDVKRIVGVGCAPNRLHKIQDYAKMIAEQMHILLPLDRLEYVDAFNMYRGFKYENTIKAGYEGLTFHPRYEAKCFKYMFNTFHSREGKNNLMWINGNSIH